MEEVTATAYLEVFVECPYCVNDIDIARKIEVNINTSYGNNHIDKTIKCNYCNQEFKVKQVIIK